ncbi:MAG: NAD(P)-dependent oxidoreductase [Planctomycetota bacterium]
MPMKTLGLLAKDGYLREEHNLAVLNSGYELHDFSDWPDYTHQQLLDACRSVEVVLTGRGSPSLPEELIEDFGQLRYLCHLHGTVRHLVSREHIEAGLLVTNWGDTRDMVAEGAMALLLGMLKQLVPLNAWGKGGEDERIHQMFPCTLNDMDVGLYGYGPIGQHHARMLEPFGANVAIYDPYAENVPQDIRVCNSLEELFSTCQAVCVHCGLNDQTRGSVTRDLLEKLPRGGILINTARGAIVDEAALAELVAQGHILAGIDVIENEGAWAESPLAPLSGAVLTRHKVSSGKGYPPGEAPPKRIPHFAADNLRRYREGRSLRHVITPELYDIKT